MKHASIVTETQKDTFKEYIEAELEKGTSVRLAESEYTQEELDQFQNVKETWILRCAGSRQFLADSDSGEDALAYYCNYFEPVPERAVFEEGKLIGLYLYTDGISYSGRGRYNYTIDDWGYPGKVPFRSVPGHDEMHVFLFSEEKTHKWKDWTLLKKDPEAEYRSYLDF